MSYKIQLTLDVTLESKQDADRLAHRIMLAMENGAENIYGVRSAVASRNTRDEFVNNLPDEEFEPGMTLLMSVEED